jgi:DNA polymerase/3'-5' exonuclease PolX
MFGQLFNEVLDLVESWEPKEKYPNEDKYRNDLMAFLREELNKPSLLSAPQALKIRKESGRALADIAINEKIGIELKKDLKTQSQVDRLVGQIRRYKKGYEDVIIVLVGKTSDEALDELKEAIRESDQGTLGLQYKKIEIVDKGREISNKKEEGTIFGGNFKIGI